MHLCVCVRKGTGLKWLAVVTLTPVLTARLQAGFLANAGVNRSEHLGKLPTDCLQAFQKTKSPTL